ncbi:glycosyl transferase [Mycobacterium xenopi 4042]|uniref:Glycosyl transferase n=1 Tax=Mycobacterium xenopi 4042 TaxID=1299334 RepID=X7Z3Z7_MYCXE|nr:glycosyl transferase [Mycobacterium xenopi 4042]
MAATHLGSKPVTRRIAGASSAGSAHTKPVTPSSTISLTAPRSRATTGVPQAIASIITIPNGSSH